VAVINLIGQLFLDAAQSPFEMAPRLVSDARASTPVVLVDFHAEATSEKVAMGRLLDGEVTAVIGTHTHVQTNDPAVLPGGTAYLTDAGMTGPHDSVIGVRAELVLRRFQTGLPVRFEPAENDVRIEGAIVDCDPGTGRAQAIELLRFSGA
jgi:metallophosphoesterase (TIGR00282 family)